MADRPDDKHQPIARAAETTEMHRELQDADFRAHEHIAGRSTSGDQNMSPLEKSYMSYMETTKNFAKVEDLAKNGTPEQILAFMKENEDKIKQVSAGIGATQLALGSHGDKLKYSASGALPDVGIHGLEKT